MDASFFLPRRSHQSRPVCLLASRSVRRRTDQSWFPSVRTNALASIDRPSRRRNSRRPTYGERSAAVSCDKPVRSVGRRDIDSWTRSEPDGLINLVPDDGVNCGRGLARPPTISRRRARHLHFWKSLLKTSSSGGGGGCGADAIRRRRQSSSTGRPVVSIETLSDNRSRP